MKPHYLFIAALTACLVACSGGSELEKKQKELAKLKDEQKSLNQQIEKLQSEVAVLTPASQRETKVTPVKVAPVSAQTFNHFI